MRSKIKYVFSAIILGVFSNSHAAIISPYKEIKIIISNDTDLPANCAVNFNNGFGSWKPGFAFPDPQGLTNLPAKQEMQGIVESNNLSSNFYLNCTTWRSDDKSFSTSYLVDMSPEGGMNLWKNGQGSLPSHIYPVVEPAMINIILHLD